MEFQGRLRIIMEKHILIPFTGVLPVNRCRTASGIEVPLKQLAPDAAKNVCLFRFEKMVVPSIRAYACLLRSLKMRLCANAPNYILGTADKGLPEMGDTGIIAAGPGETFSAPPYYPAFLCIYCKEMRKDFTPVEGELSPFWWILAEAEAA